MTSKGRSILAGALTGPVLFAACFSERGDPAGPAPAYVSCAAGAPAPPADVRIVRIQNFQYQPAQLTVTPGTTVWWINCEPTGIGNSHTSTSDDGVWSSPLLSPAGVGAYSRRFDTTGTFPYHCVPHPNMQGTITVS